MLGWRQCTDQLQNSVLVSFVIRCEVAMEGLSRLCGGRGFWTCLCPEITGLFFALCPGAGSLQPAYCSDFYLFSPTRSRFLLGTGIWPVLPHTVRISALYLPLTKSSFKCLGLASHMLLEWTYSCLCRLWIHSTCPSAESPVEQSLIYPMTTDYSQTHHPPLNNTFPSVHDHLFGVWLPKARTQLCSAWSRLLLLHFRVHRVAINYPALMLKHPQQQKRENRCVTKM